MFFMQLKYVISKAVKSKKICIFFTSQIIVWYVAS